LRFWDSSALITLHVQQEASARTRALLARDGSVIAWTLSDVEIRSALCRLEREGALDPDAAQEARTRVESLWETVHVVSLVDAVKARAKRLLGIHNLRAADALQLGAALAAASDDPTGWELVCLDARLAAAARREGFARAARGSLSSRRLERRGGR
jgi:predicted nucleic acid-binding protein